MTRNGGRTWVAFNSGLGKAVAKINAILPLESSEELFLATSRGLFRGVPEKEDWALVEGTSGISVNDLAADELKRILFLACRDGLRMLNLVDGKAAMRGLADLEVTSVLVDVERSWIFAGTSQGVFRSRDRGVSWRNTSTGLSGASVEILERAGSRLLCGTKSGLFVSENFGESWSPGQGVFPLEIVSIKANPISADQVVASNVLSGYLFTSRNGGLDWQVTDLGSSLSKISSFAYTAAGELLAGTMTEGVLQIVPQEEDRLIAAKKGGPK
jgi:ligand-binding sensor domain-containing protein